MTTGITTQVRVQAEIQLHRHISEAHETFARALEPLAEEQVEEGVPAVRGATKRRVIALPGMYAERGLSAGEIAEALNHDVSNLYPDLDSLITTGFAEPVEGASPKRWRMTVEHRRSRILRLSRLIPDGRWTSYGDFAIAVYGSNKMAITGGRVASRNPLFVRPQRVLWAEGEIKDAWKDDEGRGPEECEERLTKEGIEVVNRHADPSRFIGWQELETLLEADERANDPEID
jgi:alkylated DNA nucleotide flippase Atl1